MAAVEEQTPLLGSTIKSKPTPTPLPKLQLFIIFFIQFCEPITAIIVYPFIVQLVHDTGVTGGDERLTGYYAGFIESSFYASEALTTIQWGRLSDRIGRKPPLIFGMLGLAVVVTGFGLSTSFVPLILFRSLQGVFNGNIGITKAVVAEITDETNIARAFSLTPLPWGIGVTLAPVIGGLLSHPATRWPDTMGKIAFFRTHPYFLPCIVAATVPLIAFVLTAVFLKETLPKAVADKKIRAVEDTPSTPTAAEDSNEAEHEELPTFRSLMTRPVLIALANYCFTVFLDSASTAIQPLLYASPIGYSGLGLPSFHIGLIMGASGIVIGVSSVILFPWLSQKLGLTRLYQIACACHFLMQLAFAMMSVLVRRSGQVDGAVFGFLALQLTAYSFAEMTFCCMFIHINDAAPSRRSLGTVMGLAQTAGATVRIFAPIATSSLFSLSQQYNLLGGTMVYVILAGFVACGLVMSMWLPRKLKSVDA